MDEDRCKFKKQKLIPENRNTILLTLHKPKEAIQMDFAGPITDNNREINFLVTIDRQFAHMQKHILTAKHKLQSHIKQII